MSLSNIFVHGWNENSTESDTISTSSTPYWRFGRTSIKFDFGLEEHEWRPDYYLNSRDPAALTLSKSLVRSNIGFVPVNGIMWYYFLGDSSSAASVHSPVGLETGSNPGLCYRWEDRGGTVDEYSSIVANKVENFNFTYSRMTDQVVQGIGLIGIKQTTPALNSAHNGPVYPTADATYGGTQLNNAYKYTNGMIFSWDNAGSQDDYVPYLHEFSYTGVNALKLDYLQGQAELELINEGIKIH